MRDSSMLSFNSEGPGKNNSVISLIHDIDELKLLIDSNNEKIRILNQSQTSEPVNTINLSKFSKGAQLKSLEDENKDLSIKLSALINHLHQTQELKSKLIPEEYEIEKMNFMHDSEYKMYVSLNEKLAQIGIQKINAYNMVEIIDYGSIQDIHSSPSLFILLGLALFLSQVVGLTSIYLYELFRPLP